MNPYQASFILGLEPMDSRMDLRRKWRSLALLHHPDRGGDEEAFKELANAFSVMVNGGFEQWSSGSADPTFSQPIGSYHQIGGPVSYPMRRRLVRQVDPWYYEEQDWLENEFGHLGYWNRTGVRR